MDLPRARWERAARLVRKSDFEAVYHCGENVFRRGGEGADRRGGRERGGGGRLKSSQFVVFYCANRSERTRFGISVKKALGGAVVRNRIRRRIREILRRNYSEIPSGWDMVMHPRQSVARSNFAALQAELVSLLRTIPSAPIPGSPGAGVPENK
jgi:ribonuclease P protein component